MALAWEWGSMTVRQVISIVIDTPGVLLALVRSVISFLPSRVRSVRADYSSGSSFTVVLRMSCDPSHYLR